MQATVVTTAAILVLLHLEGCLLLQFLAGQKLSPVIVHDGISATATEKASRMCTCISTCFENPHCVGHTAHFTGFAWLCEYFFNETQYELLPSVGTIFRPGFKNPHGTFESDGLYYLALTTQVTSLEDARLACLAYPGFRLALVKTAANLAAALKHCLHCPNDPKRPFTLVDMTANENGTVLHGDGSLVSEEMVEGLRHDNVYTGSINFVFYSGAMDDNMLDEQTPAIPLCQANFLYIIH